MVSYDDGDFEEYGLEELLGMIKLLLGPVAEKGIAKTVPAEIILDDPTQKRIKKRQRSDSNLSDDDEGDTPNWKILQCYDYVSILRRGLLMIDGRQEVPDDQVREVMRRFDEWSGKLREILGVTANGNFPHLPQYRIAKSNGNGSHEGRKKNTSTNRNPGASEIVKRIMGSH